MKHNDSRLNIFSHTSRIIRLVIPDSLQAITTLLVSLLTLMAINSQLIWAKLLSILSGGENEELETYVGSALQDYVTRFDEQVATYYIVMVLFFAGAGFIAYLIILSLTNIVIEIYNKIVYETHYINRDKLIVEIKVLLRRILAATTFVTIIIITNIYGIAFWASLSSRLFLPPFSLFDVGLFVFSVIGWALNLYMLYVSFVILKKNPF